MKFKDVKVGDIVFVVEGNRGRHPLRREMRVMKVTRQNFFASTRDHRGNWHEESGYWTRFDKDGLRNDTGDYHSFTNAYHSEKEYDDMLRMTRKWNTFSRSLTRPDDMTEEELDNLMARFKIKVE